MIFTLIISCKPLTSKVFLMYLIMVSTTEDALKTLFFKSDMQILTFNYYKILQKLYEIKKINYRSMDLNEASIRFRNILKS
jgi:hypothetical protein